MCRLDDPTSKIQTDQGSIRYQYITLIIQIPIFFINNKQTPMDLYKPHTVPVHLDKDTYDGKESKYTRLHLKQNHLAIS